MALPKIDIPIQELTLPSSGERIKYRPFSVKEEKILLVGQESDDPTAQVLAAKQVVNNCLIEKEVSDLAMFDLEYVILYLRARSVNNLINFSVRDEETDERIDLEIDIDEVKIVNNPDHSKEIIINEEYRLFLRYPTIDEFAQLTTLDQEDPLTDYILLTSCIDYVASEDEVHYFKDYSREEIDGFMDSLTAKSVKDITKFFETMPKLRHEVAYTNSAGTEKTFVVEGMQTFFYLVLSHISLSNYYEMIFSMAQHHKYSISEIENLIPYERDLYFQMLVDHIKEQNEKARAAQTG